jgi:hypothetical protein
MIRRAWQLNAPLTAVGLAMVPVLVTALVGLVADPTVITGAPAWLKPAKFAISIGIYSFTFLWLLTFVAGHRCLVAAVSWVTAVATGLEMVMIVGAAALGTTSHFNVSTPLHTAVWSTMAGAIVAAWTANIAVGLVLLRQKMPDPAMAWAVRAGLLISAVGMGVAFFMTSPTPAQLAAAHDGAGMPVSGAHSVGVPDGGPGLPVVGWSTVGGDLRAPHFFGLHGLQVLPLLGLLLTRYAPSWLRPADRRGLVLTAGSAYLGVVILTTWQALRGQPLLSPDATTLGAFAVLTAGTLMAAAAIAARAMGARTALTYANRP